MRDLLSPLPAPVSLPMRPWEYVRLRRLAAGLSIEQAARPHWHHAEHRAGVEEATRLNETRGYVIKPYAVPSIARSFQFDPGVYLTLATQPPEQHPRLCRTCGWDQWTEATCFDGTSVTWVSDDDDRCTLCAEAEAYAAGVRARSRAA